jgi:hypothetical protein
MTRRDTLQCVHEPFGDAYYFGPERLAERYEDDEKARTESGYADSTYKTIFDRIAKEGSEVGLFPSVVNVMPFTPFHFTSPPSVSVLLSCCTAITRSQSISLSLHLCSISFIYHVRFSVQSPRPNDIWWLHCV